MRYKKIIQIKTNKNAEKKKKNIKRMIWFIFSFLFIFGIFEALIALEFKPTYPIYLVILTILLIVFLFFNKGFSSQLPPRDMLPERWSEAEKDRFYNKCERDKAIARRVLIFLIPFLLTFLIDSIILFLPEFFS